MPTEFGFDQCAQANLIVPPIREWLIEIKQMVIRPFQREQYFRRQDKSSSKSVTRAHSWTAFPLKTIARRQNIIEPLHTRTYGHVEQVNLIRADFYPLKTAFFHVADQANGYISRRISDVDQANLMTA